MYRDKYNKPRFLQTKKSEKQVISTSETGLCFRESEGRHLQAGAESLALCEGLGHAKIRGFKNILVEVILKSSLALSRIKAAVRGLASFFDYVIQSCPQRS